MKRILKTKTLEKMLRGGPHVLTSSRVSVRAHLKDLAQKSFYLEVLNCKEGLKDG